MSNGGMPRQVRIEYEGAVYHVMCRGDRREDIFRDAGDREMMLATLAERVGRTGWKMHAWVWMRNHYHLLIETPEPNLVQGMTWFQATYTTRFNARQQFRGHLFGGRYNRDYVERRWLVGWRHVEIGLAQVYTNVSLSRLRRGLLQILAEKDQS